MSKTLSTKLKAKVIEAMTQTENQDEPQSPFLK